MVKKNFILAISFLLVCGGFLQAGDFNHQLGISLKGSTNGIGGDLYYRPHKMFAVKAGLEYAGFNMTADKMKPYVGDALSIAVPMPTGNDLIFDAGAKYRTGALSLAVGFQPFGGLYLTAGIGKFLLGAEVTGTPASDLTFGSQNVQGVGTVTPKIARDKLGDFGITLAPTNSFAPYVGIGLGSFVPRKRRVSFAFELGAYYVGTYALKATLPPGLKSANIDYGANLTPAQKQQYFSNINSQIDGMFSQLQTEIDTSVDDINSTMKPFGFYPVIKMTIGIKAFEFGK